MDLDVIVRTALDLLDEVGLDELSMRRLAAELGVQNPALYWHVKNKQELLDRMAQALLAEGFARTEGKPRTWDRRLEQLARGFRAAMKGRRDGARVVASADLGEALSARIEGLVEVLVAEGFRAPDALGGVLTLVHYTLGATFEEQADPRGGDPVPRPGAKLPSLAGAGPAVDQRFELGMRLILDGLRQRLRTSA